MRYFGAAESCWRLLGFALFETLPPVERLPLHLDGEQNVLFREGDEEHAAANPPSSKLVDWIWFCGAPVRTPEPPAHWESLTYVQFPAYFVHGRGGWRAGARRNVRWRTVGRLPPIMCSLAQEEQYYLRVLLSHITSGEVRRLCANVPPTAVPGVHTLRGDSPSFKHACQLRGLASDDSEWMAAMAEACAVVTDRRVLLRLLVNILVYNDPADARTLVDASWPSLAAPVSEEPMFAAVAGRLGVDVDAVRRVAVFHTVADAVAQEADHSPEVYAQLIGWTPEEQRILSEWAVIEREPAVLQYELNYDRSEQQQKYEDKAAAVAQQPSQQAVLQRVQHAVEHDESLVMFLSAYAGCGKTFLEQTILHWVRAQGLIALAVASTGIAALLLEGCNTLHSKLKAPLGPYAEDTRLNIRAQEALATVIQRARILLWDEAASHPAFLANAVDQSLRDLRQRPNEPFGGMIVLFAGDFRQTLPIEPRATDAQIVALCMHQWRCWREIPVEVHYLQENQRAARLMRQAATVAERSRIETWMRWLERLGDGELNDDVEDVELWGEQCQLMATSADLDSMLDETYEGRGDQLLAQADVFWSERAILSPKHAAVEVVNSRMLARLPGELHQLYSFDVLDRAHEGMDVDADYLNRQNTGNLPPHVLELKVGAVVMLLLNLDKRGGLVNGTRMRVEAVSLRLLRCVIITEGQHFGKSVTLPRIRVKPRHRQFPFLWTRTQFPVKLCWAMTINKAQGQSLRRIAVLLALPVFADTGELVQIDPLPCFAHGQLVVALTRIGHPDAVLIYLAASDYERGCTRNALLRAALLRGEDEETMPFDDDVTNLGPLTSTHACEDAADGDLLEAASVERLRGQQHRQLQEWLERTMDELGCLDCDGRLEIPPPEWAMQELAQRLAERIGRSVSPDGWSNVTSLDQLLALVTLATPFMYGDLYGPHGVGVPFVDDDPETLDMVGGMNGNEIDYAPAQIGLGGVGHGADDMQGDIVDGANADDGAFGANAHELGDEAEAIAIVEAEHRLHMLAEQLFADGDLESAELAANPSEEMMEAIVLHTQSNDPLSEADLLAMLPGPEP